MLKEKQLKFFVVGVFLVVCLVWWGFFCRGGCSCFGLGFLLLFLLWFLLGFFCVLKNGTVAPSVP